MKATAWGRACGLACVTATVMAGSAGAQVIGQLSGGYSVPGEQTADFSAPALVRSGLFQRDTAIGPAQRVPSGYEPLPVRLGSFDLLPQLAASVAYDDNVYAQPVAASDAIFSLAPSFSLNSNWGRNALSVFGRLVDPLYLDHTGETKVQYAFGANGRYDLSNDVGLAAGASYEQDTEPRTSPGSPVQAAEPVQFTVFKAYVGGVKQYNRLRLSLGATVRDYDFDSSIPAFGGGSIAEGAQSNLQISVDARAEYAFSPGLSVFVEGLGNNRDFKDASSALFPSRDSKGFDATVGVNFQISRLLIGEAQVGYLQQDYSDLSYRQVSGPSVRGFVSYTPTPFLSVSLSGFRALEDAEIINSSGYLASVAQVKADYEFLRQLVISAELHYENDQFKGFERNDDRLSALLSGTYRINRQVNVSISYEHIQQRSSGANRGIDYDVNRLSTGLALSF